jgi:hypothetical protein
MRLRGSHAVAVVVAICATGCDLFFPLRDPPDLSDDAPMGTEIEIETFAVPLPVDGGGKETVVEFRVKGEPSKVVHYVLDGVDDLAKTDGVIALDENGTGSETVQWITPMDPVLVTITLRVSYDAMFSVSTTRDLNVEVVRLFGIFNAQSSAMQMTKDTMYGIPITVTSTGTLEMGFVSQGMANVKMGLYRDTGGGLPFDFVANSGVTTQATIGRVVGLTSVDTIPGDYWVALLFETDIEIDGLNGGAARRASQPFSGGLPATFPGTQGDFGNYTVYIMLHP